MAANSWILYLIHPASPAMTTPRSSSATCGGSGSGSSNRRRRRSASVMTAAALALCAGGKAASVQSAAAAVPRVAQRLGAAATTTRRTAFAAAPRDATKNTGVACNGRRWRPRTSPQKTMNGGDLGRKEPEAPLRMAADSRELRFFATSPSAANNGNGNSAAPFLSNSGGGAAAVNMRGETTTDTDANEFTSAATTTAVFSSSAFQKGLAGDDSRAAQFFAASMTTTQTRAWHQSLTHGVLQSIADSVTSCFSTATASTPATALSSTTVTTTVSSSSSSTDLTSEGDIYPKHTSDSSNLSPSGGGGGPVVSHTIELSDEERELFKLLTQVVQETHLTSTLRVAGGWVRDKLLATDEFRRLRLLDGELEDFKNKGKDGENEDGNMERLTSKFKMKLEGRGPQPSAGRQGTKVVGRATPKKNPSSGIASLIKTKGKKMTPKEAAEQDVPQVALRDNGAAAKLLNPDENGDNGSFLESHPVDIDVALDDMLGREFADHLNDWLGEHGRTKADVGMVLKNPEKSKHLETATMKVGDFWIDFVNLRAEEYTSDSRIPDLMRIGSADEDAYRRDLTINALFYNINTGRVEDWTGRGFDDLRRGVVSTPLPPLTTLLDDPLRVLRAVRFAARLRFTMDHTLREAAKDTRVKEALHAKVARERVGSEVDLMLRSPDPVGAMRLLIHLRLIDTVFPIDDAVSDPETRAGVFAKGLTLLSATHDHLLDCKARPPIWCEEKRAAAALSFGAEESTLIDDEESRRLLWYASFLKPFRDATDRVRSQQDTVAAAGNSGARPKGARNTGKKANRSSVIKLLVDDMKRPLRDAEQVEKIQKASDDFTALMDAGCDAISTAVLAGEVTVRFDSDEECGTEYFVDPNGDCYEVTCEMRRIDDDGLSSNGEDDFGGSSTKLVDSVTETDLLWKRAMAFRLLASKVLARVGPLWRASLVMSLSERLAKMYDDELNYAIEGDYMDQDYEQVRRATVARYDAFAAALQQLGLIGIWSQKPLVDGLEMKAEVLRAIPKGPVFRDIMNEQERWMTTHPGGRREALKVHMRATFPEFVGADNEDESA